MRARILKMLFYTVIAFFLIFFLLLFTPGLLSVLNPEKPPVGYHFKGTNLLAVALGLEELIDDTPELPSSIEEIRNIEYKSVNGKSLQLDIYKPKTIDKPVPLLVFIHGGGWQSGKRSDYLIYLVDFAKRGYVTATVSYRLLSDAAYPACIEDINDAVEWLFEHGNNYGYDTGRIALIGGSAGAHLAMLAAYGWKSVDVNEKHGHESTHRIKAVVDIYGPADLTTEYARTHPLVTNFIGNSFAKDPESYMAASPVYYLDGNDPPTLIMHGTSDDLVPISQSDNLKVKLDNLGVICVYYRLPLWPHTMDIVLRVNDYCQDRMKAFFEKYLD